MLRITLCSLALLGFGAATQAGELDKEAAAKAPTAKAAFGGSVGSLAPSAPATTPGGSELDKESPVDAYHYHGGYGGYHHGGYGGYRGGYGYGGYRGGYGYGGYGRGYYGGYGYRSYYPRYYGGFGGYGLGYGLGYGGYGLGYGGYGGFGYSSYSPIGYYGSSLCW